MLSKRKLRNKSGGEACASVVAGQEESPLKKSLRRHGEETEELNERPVRTLRHRDKPENKDGEDGGEKQRTKLNDRKSKGVEKNKSYTCTEVKSQKLKTSKDEGDGGEKDKKFESIVGPMKMSDRKSGDVNMFGAKLQPVTIKISKNLYEIKVVKNQNQKLHQECDLCFLI